MERQIIHTGKKIDGVTAPKLESELNTLIEQGSVDLEVDMEETGYISSVGLRVLLKTHKTISKQQGELTISHVKPQVKEIFEISGFSGILNIL